MSTAEDDAVVLAFDRKRGSPDLDVAVRLEDFWAHMPTHTYIYLPTRESWPASSVNSRIQPVEVDGKKMPANAWLDRHRPVEQMSWIPGEPPIIFDKLMADGGWTSHPGTSCLNLYRPPEVELGDPMKATRWIEHSQNVFGADCWPITQWLAHRRQRPHEKINHALVLGGPQGIGKDTLLQPARHAVGEWNFGEVSPHQLLGRFNPFLKSTILRVNEARDLGEVNRYQFYERLKSIIAAPPDSLLIDEKNLRAFTIPNVCAVTLTTNYKTDGIYLPADDRRHYVAWSKKTKEDFSDTYWRELWTWYENGGYEHVAAFLQELDLSNFNPKAAPKKTEAFWAIVDASRAPEDSELADVLDKLHNPDAVTLTQVANMADGDFALWIRDRKNRRNIPHRMEAAGYLPVRNDAASDGLWVVNSRRLAIYAKTCLTNQERFKAARNLTS